jgi:hypothetical protein
MDLEKQAKIRPSPKTTSSSSSIDKPTDAGPRARGTTFMGPASENLHKLRKTR